MYLKHKPSGKLLEVLSIEGLYNPGESEVTARFHAGEEMQNPDSYPKENLIFPSGESLPQCWVDMNYRQEEVPVGGLPKS